MAEAGFIFEEGKLSLISGLYVFGFDAVACFSCCSFKIVFFVGANWLFFVVSGCSWVAFFCCVCGSV